MAFIVHLTNMGNSSPEFETFEAAVVWARRAGFEAGIWDTSQKINFGHLLVASFSPISGLRDLRPFAGKEG